jgi:hypothetical protein
VKIAPRVEAGMALASMDQQILLGHVLSLGVVRTGVLREQVIPYLLLAFVTPSIAGALEDGKLVSRLALGWGCVQVCGCDWGGCSIYGSTL